MTRDEVRAAARRVTRWHERFAPLFGRKEAQEHSRVYVKGLMSDQKRKSVEPIALQFARGPDGAAATQNEVVALQGFLTQSPWEVTDVFREIQAVFAEELMPTSAAMVDRHGGRDRRVGLRQGGHGERGRGPAVVRTAGEDRQLPGGRVPDGRHAGRRGGCWMRNCSSPRSGPPTGASQEDARSQGGQVPDQAADRGGDDPADAGRGQGAVRLDHRRRVVRRQRRFPRRPGRDAPAVRGGGEEEHLGVDGRSGDACPAPSLGRSGGGSSDRTDIREVQSVEEVAAGLPAEAWQPLMLREGCEGAVGVRVCRACACGRCVTTSRARRSGCCCGARWRRRT